MAKFVKSFCEKENLLPLDKGATAKIVEFSSRLADDREKLSTKFNEIGEIIGEASTWGKIIKTKNRYKRIGSKGH